MLGGGLIEGECVEEGFGCRGWRARLAGAVDWGTTRPVARLHHSWNHRNTIDDEVLGCAAL